MDRTMKFCPVSEMYARRILISPNPFNFNLCRRLIETQQFAHLVKPLSKPIKISTVFVQKKCYRVGKSFYGQIAAVIFPCYFKSACFKSKIQQIVLMVTLFLKKILWIEGLVVKFPCSLKV